MITLRRAQRFVDMGPDTNFEFLYNPFQVSLYRNILLDYIRVSVASGCRTNMTADVEAPQWPQRVAMQCSN